MPKSVLIVSATEAEASVIKRIPGIGVSGNGFILGRCEISLLVTGVGAVATAWSLTKCLSSGNKPDLALNIGIAGSFVEEIPIGSVVVPVEDCFADAGIEDGSRFMTLAETGLQDPDMFPFKNGKLIADNRYTDLAKDNFKPVRAITVNTATGSEQTKSRIVAKYNPDIETMEGAAFFYICSGENLSFLALRAISNKVETRDRARWNIPQALDSLAEKLKELLLLLD